MSLIFSLTGVPPTSLPPLLLLLLFQDPGLVSRLDPEPLACSLSSTGEDPLWLAIGLGIAFPGP